MKYTIGFVNSSKGPVTLEEGDCLSEKLSIENSPILFGCRTGICGTCAIEIVEDKDNQLHPRTAQETEYLEAIGEENPKCRLACQIRLNANIVVKKIEV